MDLFYFGDSCVCFLGALDSGCLNLYVVYIILVSVCLLNCFSLNDTLYYDDDDDLCICFNERGEEIGALKGEMEWGRRIVIERIPDPFLTMKL